MTNLNLSHLGPKTTTLSQECVSIVIPTAHRPNPLRECLDSLQRHAARSEIIVVGESNDEATRELVRGYRSVKYFENDDSSRVVARNIGIAHASREILVFVDDDVVVEEYWLENLLRHYTDSSVGGVGGRVKIPGSLGSVSLYKTGEIVDGFVIGNWDGPILRALDVKHLPGSNMSFRRVLVNKAGGFDDFFRVYSFREDTDLCIRIRNLGYRLVFEPTASLVHKALGRGSVGSRWVFEYVRNTLYLYLKYDVGRGSSVAFFRRLVFPPAEYVTSSGVRVRITVLAAIAAISGLIAGILGYLAHGPRRSQV